MVGGWYFWSDGLTPAAEADSKALAALSANGAVSAASGPGGLAPNGPYTAEGLKSRQEQLAMWRSRYAQAEQLYSSYRDSTRYPFDSRPIAEHPDQVRPFAPISEDVKLINSKGEVVKGVRMRTTQERVFLSGTESVKFTIAAIDDNGRALGLLVRSASAQSIPDSRTPIKLIQAQVPFSDDGNAGDEVARDGVYSARLTPATQGFKTHAGTIRVLAEVASESLQGVVQFDVVYTPEVPATWTGIREAVEAGSLNFYLKADIRQAGRYVVSGRVDDANGVPFALVQFNNDVGIGAREFKLSVFGALILDKNPIFPLRLRDVDGFLLLPDAFPDRLNMARQPGVVHVSADYPKSRFSAAEWTSEERQRYLTEYGNDAETARRQVEELSPK